MYIHEASVRSLPTVRYRINDDLFYRICKQRIDEYFKNRNISPYANRLMVGKTVFLVVLFLTSYSAMYVFQPRGVFLILLQSMFYFTMFLMAVGIAHDGTHDSYSPKKWINKAMSRIFDFIGINSYLWDFNHVRSHHNAPNIPIFDSAIFSISLFRLHPRAEYCWFHRYQHFYIFFIYSLSTLFKVFVFDFFSFGRDRIGYVNTKNHSISQLLYLIFTKIFVVTYTLILPLAMLEAPAWQIVTGFLIGNLISGLALGVIFMVTHLHEYTKWPEPEPNGVINNSFPRHIFETTSDFAVNNWLITWISGGLNIHVVHHLFPRIYQIHLPTLVEIVKQTAVEFGIKYYTYPTTWSAVKSHLKTIRQLGQPDVMVPLAKPLWAMQPEGR